MKLHRSNIISIAVAKTSAAAPAKSIIQEITHQITIRPRVVKTRRKQEARTSSEIVHHRICRGSFWRQNQIRRRSMYNPRMKGLLAGDCKDRLTPVSTISLYYDSAYRRCHQSPELWLLHNKTHSSSRDNPHHKTSRHELRWWVMVFYVTTRLMLFQVINFTQLFHLQGWSFDFKSRNVFKALDLILLADLLITRNESFH